MNSKANLFKINLKEVKANSLTLEETVYTMDK